MNSFRLVEPSIAFIDADDFFDKNALVAHNCYQVADKGHDENILFISRLIKNQHLAMIEHKRFIFKVDKEHFIAFQELNNPYIKLIKPSKSVENIYLVSCSLRVMLEAKTEREIALFHYLERALKDDVRALFVDLPLGECASEVSLDDYRLILTEKEIDDLSFYTYQIITDRGVTHELVRHRPCSFAQESTRYCNYTKDKFSNQLTFIKPLRYEEFKDIYDKFFKECTDTYFSLVEKGAKPEEARSVLPNSLKTSIMVSADLTEWKHIFELRCSPFAHPDINTVMTLVKEDMIRREILK